MCSALCSAEPVEWDEEDQALDKPRFSIKMSLGISPSGTYYYPAFPHRSYQRLNSPRATRPDFCGSSFGLPLPRPCSLSPFANSAKASTVVELTVAVAVLEERSGWLTLQRG